MDAKVAHATIVKLPTDDAVWHTPTGQDAFRRYLASCVRKRKEVVAFAKEEVEFFRQGTGVFSRRVFKTRAEALDLLASAPETSSDDRRQTRAVVLELLRP